MLTLVLPLLKTLALFVVTALAEILGCWLTYLWLRAGGSAWLLVPAAVSLAVFASLLTLHPTGAARTYTAYGGVYVAVAIGWLWLVEGKTPNRWDIVGGLVALTGMAIIIVGNSSPAELREPARDVPSERGP